MIQEIQSIFDFSRSSFSHLVRKSRYQNIIHIKKEKSFFLNSELKLAGTTRNYFKKMCHVLWEQFCCSYKYTKAARNRSQLFKGYYLRCKTITCDKMCHLKHRLRIFLFHRKIMFHSQDIQVFVFLTIPWFTKSSFEPQLIKLPNLTSW